MAMFPVSDDQSLQDAVNYLLSGPSGLGQNFTGFSTSETGYLTGNYRTPYTQVDPASLYVYPIPLSTSEMLDEHTWKYTFSSTQPFAPFALGNNIEINGVADSYYDGTYTPIGVIECTTDYVIVRTTGSYAIVAPSTGGTATYTNMDTFMSTDCNSKVVVTGGTDRVFISAQLDNIIDYFVPTGTESLQYKVAVNRYIGSPSTDITKPGIVFLQDKTVAEKTYNFTGLTGSGSLPIVETVFVSVIDSPAPAYYWYILEIEYQGVLEVTRNTFKLRSFTTQVVKQ